MKRALLFLGMTALAGVLWADGGFFPPPGSVIWEPSQQAVIEYQASEEILHLLVTVDNDQNEGFGWIVPLPSIPAVEEDSMDLFDQIEEMCRPSWGGGGCFGGGYGLGDGEGYYPYEVDIVDQGSVGKLDYKTIEATSADTLFGWLVQNGYEVSDSAKADTVFADYISRDWVFVVFKVSDVSSGENFLQPVKFTFSSAEIVYPMKITSLMYDEDYYYYDLSFLVHVITDHRVKLDDNLQHWLDTEYANSVNASEYKAIEKHYPAVAGVCAEGDFITRLYSYIYNPDDLNYDYVFVPNDNDDEISGEGGYYWSDALLFPSLPVAFVFGLRIGRIFKRKKKKGK